MYLYVYKCRKKCDKILDNKLYFLEYTIYVMTIITMDWFMGVLSIVKDSASSFPLNADLQTKYM